MRFMTRRSSWPGLFLVALAVGCSSSPASRPAVARPSAGEDAEVRKRFAELEEAVKLKDADKLWALLSTKSQDDTERIAKGVSETYVKAGADEKKTQPSYALSEI